MVCHGPGRGALRPHQRRQGSLQSPEVESHPLRLQGEGVTWVTSKEIKELDQAEVCCY